MTVSECVCVNVFTCVSCTLFIVCAAPLCGCMLSLEALMYNSIYIDSARILQKQFSNKNTQYSKDRLYQTVVAWISRNIPVSKSKKNINYIFSELSFNSYGLAFFKLYVS